MSQQFHLTALVGLIALAASITVSAQSRNIDLQTADGPLTVPLDDAAGVQILPDGDISATATSAFSCQQGTTCDDVQVSMASPNGALFLDRATVEQGSNVQATWQSRGAWSCSGTGLPGTVWNTNNPKQPEGSALINTDNVSLGSYTLELTCSNGPVTDTRTTSLTIEEQTGPTDPVPAGCEGVGSLSDYAGWTRTVDGRPSFGTNEDQVFSEYMGAWPGGGSTVNIGIPKDEYIAMSFTTGALDAGSSGQFNREQVIPTYQNAVGAGQHIVSFSRCPGDFDPNSTALDSPSCVMKAAFNFSTVSWGGPGSGRACQLEPNTVYYMNIVYTDSAVGTLPPVQAACGGKNRCGHLWQGQGVE